MEEKITDCHFKNLEAIKAYTYYLVPFYFDSASDWNSIIARLDRWHLIHENMYQKEDILYPYIMDLFKQNKENAKNGKQHLDIYRFIPQLDRFDIGDGERFSRTLFPERVLGKDSIAFIGKNRDEKKNPKTVQFTLLNDGNFAPHLFISQTARIGIVTFCLELKSPRNVDTLKCLNYFLHKRDEKSNFQCVCPRPEKQKGLNVLDASMDLFRAEPDFWKLNQKTTLRNDRFVCWNPDDLVNIMLATMGKPKDGIPRIRYFSQDRMHVFTFCSFLDKENRIERQELIPESLRLARCVNDNYMLPFRRLEEEGHTLETYENIHFASAFEGASMICLGKPENASFVNELHNSFNRQYLLVYILVLIQRYTLLNLESLLTAFESTEKVSDEDLWNLIEIICRIKVNCYYTDVSVYTHYSEFYSFCCRNQCIPDTYKEIGDKVELLKLTTEKNMQVRMKEQESRQQEALTRIQEEERNSERRQRFLNWVVAVLTIAQVMEAANELIKYPFDERIAFRASFILGSICILLLIILAWRDIVRYGTSALNRKKKIIKINK